MLVTDFFALCSVRLIGSLNRFHSIYFATTESFVKVEASITSLQHWIIPYM